MKGLYRRIAAYLTAGLLAVVPAAGCDSCSKRDPVKQEPVVRVDNDPPQIMPAYVNPIKDDLDTIDRFFDETGVNTITMQISESGRQATLVRYDPDNDGKHDNFLSIDMLFRGKDGVQALPELMVLDQDYKDPASMPDFITSFKYSAEGTITIELLRSELELRMMMPPATEEEEMRLKADILVYTTASALYNIAIREIANSIQQHTTDTGGKEPLKGQTENKKQEMPKRKGEWNI